MSDVHEDHGHSVAAWVSVAIVMVGAVIMMFAVLFPTVWLFVVGAVVAVLGGLSAKVLSMAGFGAKPPDKRDSVDTA